MRRPGVLTTISAAIGVCAAIACAARMNVSSHVDRGRDFSVYRTYQWGPADALPTGDPRLDHDPFFVDRLQGAVEKSFAVRALQLSADTADLIVHYHANVTERIDVNSVDRAYGYCYSEDCPPHVRRYEAGSIVIDVIDARTNRLVWRGWAQVDIAGVLGNRARLAALIDEAVTRMMQRFPRAIESTAAPAAR